MEWQSSSKILLHRVCKRNKGTLAGGIGNTVTLTRIHRTHMRPLPGFSQKVSQNAYCTVNTPSPEHQHHTPMFARLPSWCKVGAYVGWWSWDVGRGRRRVDVGTGVIVRRKYAWYIVYFLHENQEISNSKKKKVHMIHRIGAGSSRRRHVPEPWCLSSPSSSALCPVVVGCWGCCRRVMVLIFFIAVHFVGNLKVTLDIYRDSGASPGLQGSSENPYPTHKPLLTRNILFDGEENGSHGVGMCARGSFRVESRHQ